MKMEAITELGKRTNDIRKNSMDAAIHLKVNGSYSIIFPRARLAEGGAAHNEHCHFTSLKKLHVISFMHKKMKLY
jgi:hypothetical protein